MRGDTLTACGLAQSSDSRACFLGMQLAMRMLPTLRSAPKHNFFLGGRHATWYINSGRTKMLAFLATSSAQQLLTNGNC